MATVINAYSVSLGLDASSYIDASKLSRTETNALKRDIESARDPTEKLAREQDRLTKALETGAISQEVYVRLLQSKTQKLLGVSEAEKEVANELERINKLTSEGESLTTRMLTAEERHAVELRKLDDLLRTQSIGQETYARAVEESRRRLFGLSDAEIQAAESARRLENAMNEGASVTRRYESNTERYARELSRLDELYNLNAISARTYERALNDLNDSTFQRTNWIETLSNVGNIVTGLRSNFEFLRDGIELARRSFEAFNSIAQELDATKDVAEKLGLTFNEFGSLRFAARRLGGDQAASALESAMSQAMKRGMVEPGESAVQAFVRISDEIAGITDQAERTQAAIEAFGKPGAELVAVLQSGGDEIEKLASQWEKTNGLTQTQIEQIGAYNDTLEDAENKLKGISAIFISEISPTLKIIIEDVSSLLGGFESTDELARSFSDKLAFASGLIVDMAEATKALLTLDWNNERLNSDVALFENALANVVKLGLERKRIEQEADAASAKRDSDRALAAEKRREQALKGQLPDDMTKQKESFKDLVDGNKSVWEDFIKERETREKNLIKSIDEAEKELDRQRKERDKVRQELSKGPMSAEVGSADAAKFLAEQANRQIAEQVAGDKGKPTEDQLLEEARKQLELMEKQKTQNEELKKKLQELIDATKENGFKRIR